MATENHAEFHLVIPAHLTEESAQVQATFRGCERCAAVALAGLMTENKMLFEMVGAAVGMAMRRKEELAQDRAKQNGKELVDFKLN